MKGKHLAFDSPLPSVYNPSQLTSKGYDGDE